MKVLKNWKPRTRRRAQIIGLCVLLLLVGLTIWLSRMARIGTGYAAKVAGSATFVAGRSRDSIVNGGDLDHIPFVQWEANRDEQSVTAWIGLIRQTAAVRPGLGTALLHGRSGETKFTAPENETGQDDLRPWPTGDGQSVNQESVNEELASIVAAAFEEPSNDPENHRGVRAIIVVQDGQIVAEQYASGFDRHTPLIGWSMTKSLTSALTGILVGQGKIDVHADAVLPEWSAPNDPRSKLTLDHLLRMSSGLEFGEVYDEPLSDVCQMLFSVHDAGGYAAAKPLEAVPDAVWKYSSGTTNIISKILRNVVANDASYHAMPRELLFDRIGMRHTVIETDPSGTFVGSSFGWATARDWARFGLLYLNDGVWLGERILPEGWVDYCRTPTARAPNGQYGAQWWCNAGTNDDGENRLWPRLPADLFAARGFQGQSINIFPTQKLVVVKLARSYANDPFDEESFLVGVLDAIEAR